MHDYSDRDLIAVVLECYEDELPENWRETMNSWGDVLDAYGRFVLETPQKPDYEWESDDA